MGTTSTTFALLEIVRDGGPLPSPVLVRIALDLLEPLAASTAATRVGARRAGSRFDVANVRIGVRGRAKLVGRGNRSGLELLLWEILAGRRAPEGEAPPLAVLVEDVEPEVAHVVDSAMAGSPELADAHALAKALVVASAGSVATHRDVAKAIAAVVGRRAADAPPAPAPEAPRPPVAVPDPAPAEASSHAVAVPKAAEASSRAVALPEAAPEPAPVPVPEAGPAEASSRSAAPDPIAEALDAALDEELERLEPGAWEALGAEPQRAEGAMLPPAPAPPAGAPAHEAVTLDGDDLVEVVAPPPLPARRPPPPPPPALARPDVLLMEADDLTAAHLTGVLRRAGYAVETCRDVEAGIARACATQPGCVVCDEESLGVPGATIALRARTNSPRGCLSPFVVLSAHEGRAAPPQTRAGSRDVWIQKPFSTEALIDRVATFCPRRAPGEGNDSSMLPPAGETAMNGDLALISLRAVLSMLEIEKRTGVLHVTSGDRTAKLSFRAGAAAQAKVLGRKMRGADAVPIVLAWEDGSFSFKTVDPTADRWSSAGPST